MSKVQFTGKSVYVLGVDFQVKDEIPWQEAVTHILLGKMTPFLSHPTRRIRSAGGSVDMAAPLIVQLKYWTKARPNRKVDLNSRATRADILRRDGHTCAYCGGHATTIDHIKPESRCKRDGDAHGGSTWGNLVAACKKHNSEKRDRTPEEAGMRLLWDAHLGADRYHVVQEEVWKILNSTGGYVLNGDSFEGILL